MRHIKKLLVVTLLGFSLLACKKSDPDPVDPVVPEPPVAAFAKGADVGWITQMESEGRKFYTAAGVETDGMALLKSLGMNTIRLRVWVNPTDGWNGGADVMAKAQRAKALGMRLMIDFHYSDTWADPGHQIKPASWSGQDINALAGTLKSHTTAVLTGLKTAGIEPEWVQVGNETNDGMLWPEGKASSSMANFAKLVNAGYDAVKSVLPNTKVIVHISNGSDNGLFRWMFDGLKANNAKYDVIGLSLYPSPTTWTNTNNQALVNMKDMVARYGKEVMVVEVGMSWDSPTESSAFLSDIIAKTKSVSGGKGLGVIYWEPQAYANWQGYTLGAFDNSGKPTAAMSAFAN